MASRTYAAAAAAAALLAAQPCAAADDFRERRMTDVRPGAFAGVTLRMPIGEGAPRRPRASLRFTSVASIRDAAGASTTRYAEGVEIGAGPNGRVSLSIGGQGTAQLKDRLGVGGSTGTTLLIVGGVVLVVFVLASVAGATPTPGPSN